MVVVGDVPVDATEQLEVVFVGAPVGVRTRVVAVLLLKELSDAVEVALLCTRDVLVDVSLAVIRRSPAVSYARHLCIFGVGEEEELVLHDRAAEGEAVGRCAVLAALAEVGVVNAVAVHVLVVVVDVCRTLECVRTRLCYGVDAAADEVGLAHIVRRNHYLHLVDGVHRDRIAAARELRCQTEVVVEVRTVECEVCRTSVTACEAHAVSVRREACDVRDAAVDGRNVLHLCLRDVGRCTGLLACELRTLCAYYYLAQLVLVFAHVHVEVVGLTELQSDARNVLLGVADVANSHLVRTADTHTLDGIASVDVSRCGVACARRLMHSLHNSADKRLAVALKRNFS